MCNIILIVFIVEMMLSIQIYRPLTLAKHTLVKHSLEVPTQNIYGI
jgi:hypothetical protein